MKKIMAFALTLVLLLAACSYSTAEKQASTSKQQIKKGEFVKFGKYEQDNNLKNGKEEIEWLVLDVKDDKALLISKYALDYQQWHPRTMAAATKATVNWNICSLREWLNDSFYNTAFSSEEQERIITTVQENLPAVFTADFRFFGGGSAEDKAFVLSKNEVNRYFSSNSARQCKPTKYAEAQGAFSHPQSGTTNWWLRTVGGQFFHVDCAAVVNLIGEVSSEGLPFDLGLAVRPAIWIDLNP